MRSWNTNVLSGDTKTEDLARTKDAPSGNIISYQAKI